jgi:hypothetical protein
MDYVARHLATGGHRGLFIMADAFTLAKRMQGVTAAAWNEMLGPDRVQAVESSPKSGASFSSLRGKLQREHASRMVGLVLLGDARGAATQPSRHSHRRTGRRDPAVATRPSRSRAASMRASPTFKLSSMRSTKPTPPTCGPASGRPSKRPSCARAQRPCGTAHRRPL